MTKSLGARFVEDDDEDDDDILFEGPKVIPLYYF
jgi:hypothetical protein